MGSIKSMNGKRSCFDFQRSLGPLVLPLMSFSSAHNISNFHAGGVLVCISHYSDKSKSSYSKEHLLGRYSTIWSDVGKKMTHIGALKRTNA